MPLARLYKTVSGVSILTALKGHDPGRTMPRYKTAFRPSNSKLICMKSPLFPSWSQPINFLPVEATFDEFVASFGGEKIATRLPKSPPFSNADYFLLRRTLVVELKSIETEFGGSRAFMAGFDETMRDVLKADPTWRPQLFGGKPIPKEFLPKIIRLYRPPLARILKKANAQIRETKKHFGLSTAHGVLFMVNDRFLELPPDSVRALIASVLAHSYSSIDCFVYLTLNTYVEVPSSEYAHLLWVPCYAEKAPDFLVDQINHVGRAWFDFLDKKIGPVDVRAEVEDGDFVKGARGIRIPN